MLSLTEEALGGLSAGVIGTIIGYPLDVTKTHLQTGGSNNKSFLSVGTTLIRTRGIASLYRGVAPPLLSLSILNTLNFASYSYFQATIGAHRGRWDGRNAVAGACCGPVASSISTVETTVRTQMQLHQGYRSSWDCVRQLVRRGGPGMLYTGHVVNTAREMVFLLTYFYIYEGLRTQVAHVADSATVPTRESAAVTTSTAWWAVPLAGGISGAVAWTISFPLDCVRAGVQGRDLMSSSTTKNGTAMQVFRQLVATRGLRGLYAGVTPSILRAFLVSGTRFSAYETTLWLLRGGRDMHQDS